jgi:hypothetical protein
MPGLIADQYDDLTGAVQQVRISSPFPTSRVLSKDV